MFYTRSNSTIEVEGVEFGAERWQEIAPRFGFAGGRVDGPIVGQSRIGGSRELEESRSEGLSKKFRISPTPSNLIRDAAEERAAREEAA